VIKLKRILKKQIEHLQKQENRMLNKKATSLLQQKLSPMLNKIEEKIPDKLKSTLNEAFYKGFKLVFEKGDPFIEKTYNKERLLLEYDLNNYAVDKILSNQTLKNLDKLSKRSNLINSSLSVVEGTVLGILGIGLPDIPLFIAVIIKTIYEIALSYGFDYKTEQEKYYMLVLICASMTKGEKKLEYNSKLEHFEHNSTMQFNLEEEMKLTASVLSEALLTSKFIQGLPVIGVVGGIVNHSIISKISKFSVLKYKKRYLRTKQLPLRS
jgi:hypothetical protein